MPGANAISSMRMSAPTISLTWAMPPAYLPAGQQHLGPVPHHQAAPVVPNRPAVPAFALVAPTETRAAPAVLDLPSASDYGSGASGLRWRVQAVDCEPAGVAAVAAQPQHQASLVTMSHATDLSTLWPLAVALARKSAVQIAFSCGFFPQQYTPIEIAVAVAVAIARRALEVADISPPAPVSFPLALAVSVQVAVAVPSSSFHVTVIATPPLWQVSLAVASLPVADTPPPLTAPPPVALALAIALSVPLSTTKQLMLRVSRLPVNDRWETMLQHIFRDISRVLTLDVDFERGTGRLVLAEKKQCVGNVCKLASWVVLSGVLFEIVEPIRNPTPRPVFVVLNLPTDANYYNVITGFVAAARARGVYEVSLDLMDESPLPGKRSWFGFLTVFPRFASEIMTMDGTTLSGAMGPLRLIKVDDPPAFFARGSCDLAKLLEEYRDVIV
ncbi:hypothetical protein GGF32_009568 [Allomyces javanicus]|nr:hypothetical protein GGF32_009568 [Allomyces javanicus]